MRNERSYARPYRASRSDYLYGSTAPARRSEQAPDFNVIPGRRSGSDVVVLPTSIVGIAKIIAVVAVVLALVCCVRVGLAAASVTTSMESDALSAQIETARSTGNDLEVQQSQLSNSMHIRLEAASLGMAAPAQTEKVTLSQDLVALDASGSLSLSGSIAAQANQG